MPPKLDFSIATCLALFSLKNEELENEKDTEKIEPRKNQPALQAQSSLWCASEQSDGENKFKRLISDTICLNGQKSKKNW